jgi:hypothetical protein
MTEKPAKQPLTPIDKPGKGRKIAVAIVLGILTIPAAAIAFFASCLASLQLGDNAAMVIGGVCAVLTIVGMVVLILKINR